MSRASDYRSRKRDRLSKLTVEATGETFIVRRVAVDAWIMAGRIPETLAREVLSAWHQVQNAEANMENMSVDQVMSGLHVVRDLVLYACVSPKLVIGDIEPDPEKDEVHFVELEPEERQALIGYCMTGQGAVPIEATNGVGVLTADAVATFPESGERSEPVPVSQNG
jgi:hypothetical protein